MVHGRDIRYALRLLARSPGFTLLTVLVLAGGLGLSTFTFSFLHTAMIRPIPLPEGDRIVRLIRVGDGRRAGVDEVDLAALRASMRTVEHLAGYTSREVLLGRDGDTRVLDTTVADPALFMIARTPARLGRTLLPSDAEPGAEPVMVLAHRAWQVVFGAEPAVLERRVTLNGISTRIVGIMPDGYGFPIVQEAWVPLPARAAAAIQADTSFLSVGGRLAPGVTHAEAAAEATALLRRSVAARTATGQPMPVLAMRVESYPAAQIGDERTIVFASLNLAAGLILLLSLVNVATLLTARANERIRETAVRLALGASAGRLVVQGMWEGAILCVAGGVLGTAAAAWGLGAITRWTRANMEANLTFWWVWHADRITILSAAAFVTLAIGALGALVSFRALRINVREIMQDGSARAGSRRDGRLARVLVVTQVTTVTVLMFVGVLSAVMARRILDLDPGYDPAKLLQVGLAPSAPRFATSETRARLFVDVQARLAAHGALDGALLRTRLASRDASGVFEVRSPAPAAGRPSAHVLAMLGAMSTVGVRPIEGRLFLPADDWTQAPVVLISRSLAARHWPGRSPVGDRLRLAAVGDTSQWRTIVGVVSDVPYGNPLARDRSAEAIYLPLLQAGVDDTDVLVRYRTSETAGRQALYQVLGAADPDLTPGYVHRAEEVIRQAGMITTGLAKLFGACFALALLLAVAGTYGLMSTSIGQRTREIAVRRALGATEATATRMLLLQGARQLGIGTLVAAPMLAALGIAATQLLPVGAVLTAGVGLLVSAAIIGVILAATWLPIRKALRVPLRTALLLAVAFSFGPKSIGAQLDWQTRTKASFDFAALAAMLR